MPCSCASHGKWLTGQQLSAVYTMHKGETHAQEAGDCRAARRDIASGTRAQERKNELVLRSNRLPECKRK